MSVYFVYRSHYDNPGCKHVRRFPAATVLDWFRAVWEPIPAAPDGFPDLADARADELIGRHVYSFAGLFEKIAEHGWPPPRTMRELAGRLSTALYVEGLKFGGHHVQILTDDDELEMAVYVFDGTYAAKHPDRAAFLLGEDWRLPDGAAEGGFRPKARCGKAPPLVPGDGATYLVALAAYDSGGLTDLSPGEMALAVDGVRVPDFPRYLLAADPDADALPAEVADLVRPVAEYAAAAAGDERALLAAVRASPADPAAWAAYSDWLEEHGRRPAGPHLLSLALTGFFPANGSIRNTRQPGRDEVLVRGHVAQACKHVAEWDGHGHVFHHFVLFDDLWAAARPDLANSLLRFASRWDVL